MEGAVDRGLRGEKITLTNMAVDFGASALTAGVLDNIIRGGGRLFGKAATEAGETEEKDAQERAEEVSSEKIVQNVDDAGN